MGNAPNNPRRQEIVLNLAQRQGQIVTTIVSSVPSMNLHVHCYSFKLIPTPPEHSLVFTIDSLDVSLVTVYFFGVEMLDKPEVHTVYFAVDTTKFPYPCSYRFPKGMKQPFPAETCKINLNDYMHDISASVRINQYHIIVTIKPEKSESQIYESSFLRIEEEKNGWKAVLIRQKLHSEKESFVLNEIYGLSATNVDNYCVVCMNGKCNVTLIPCKHMCMCEECAGVLADSELKKCPICRKCKDYLVVTELVFLAD